MPTYETVQLQKVKEIAARNNWLFLEEPSTRYCAKLITPKNVYFLIGAELGINNSGSSRVCSDKAYTQYFLELENINIIPTKVIIGTAPRPENDKYPIIIKPNIGWGGRGISLASDYDEFLEAVNIAKKYSDVILEQKYIEMPEYRMFVFNSSVYFTYQRTPPLIKGDGISDLKELIAALVVNTNAKIDYSDERLLFRLKQLKIDLNTILPEDVTIELFLSANLSSGGNWIDKSSEVSAFYKSIAIRAAKAIGLVVAGIDLFCKNIAQEDEDYYIIEVNGSPGLQYLKVNPEMTNDFFRDLENYLKDRG